WIYNSLINQHTNYHYLLVFDTETAAL
ncbi:hypothetical protein ATR1_171c0001, partial [Acetobacter tropicalis]